ncbi:molybdopterin molybdotransferase MoeA [Desulfoluna spongiiphila]|uniref:Molybdopterin molybdenumtransferase n=1 Tax=Desulfoluna spongiiphila TaxID=419481 RepID=A0A1G5JM62_9BACT|nr:gephyrin-like molybdotransferase Glp [Desulfoluna spongiiphila]SCY88788.1 molybdopterin molybdochelatase [Desulfoluna spongiiphila]
MTGFFNVSDLHAVTALVGRFPVTEAEEVPLGDALGRTLAGEVASDVDIPGFDRATMDGYAVKGADTFGASDGSPAWLRLAGTVAMGDEPAFALKQGEAAAISTGGMLPDGADAVVMVEHTDQVDGATIEVYRSVAPGHHVITRGEDFEQGRPILAAGTRIGAAEAGLLAAAGRATVAVRKKPRVGIVSTGDEVVSVDTTPTRGEIRDINTHTLSAMVTEAGGEPRALGIAGDGEGDLEPLLNEALASCDMVLISGGSSVGMRDRTLAAMEGADESEVLVHGIAISPGKPTILARIAGKPVWGLPGHVASAMVVFEVVVRPFLLAASGSAEKARPFVSARLTRNIASAQGRTDFVRTRLVPDGEGYRAEPLPGKSGLIHTMVHADGLVRIERDTEGLYRDSRVTVHLLP